MGSADSAMAMKMLMEAQVEAPHGKSRKEKESSDGFPKGKELKVTVMGVDATVEIIQVLTNAVDKSRDFVISIPQILIDRLGNQTITVDEDTLIGYIKKRKAKETR